MILYDPIRYEQIHISEVPDDEVFKICLEFYHHFSQDLYQASVSCLGMYVW